MKKLASFKTLVRTARQYCFVWMMLAAEIVSLGGCVVVVESVLCSTILKYKYPTAYGSGACLHSNSAAHILTTKIDSLKWNGIFINKIA